jgi:hypothetical protein
MATTKVSGAHKKQFSQKTQIMSSNIASFILLFSEMGNSHVLLLAFMALLTCPTIARAAALDMVIQVLNIS